MRSCINYSNFRKLNVQLTQREVPKVIGADGGDLGSMVTVQLTLRIGTSKVTQDFIVCRELRRNIILGVDFAKCNCVRDTVDHEQNKGVVIEWNQGS